MEKMQISFPDGQIRKFERGVTAKAIAASISPDLRKKAVAGKLNGRMIDLETVIEENGNIEIVTENSEEGIEVIRHSTAHLMAQAIKRVFPEEQIQLGVGPVIDNGFYYDLDMAHSLTPDDLPVIEKEMKKIVNENLQIIRRIVSREKALNVFEDRGEDLKVELLAAIPEDEPVTIYEQGEFVDLCRGPHVPSTSKLKVFKLMKIAGAYWRGDSNNKMLQRIYGVAFSTETELEEYLHFLEEARKRDHRKIGKELKLFMFSDEAPGMPFYLPNGQTLRNELLNFSRDVQDKNSYEEVYTPIMMKQRLWEQSGHWDHYHENMYFSEADGIGYALKPMNCPGHMLIYKNELRSYRDLPIRMSEIGQVHRHEFSGSLNGMIRVRAFCQDDAHIFVTPVQIEKEIEQVIQLIDYIYKVLGFEYAVELSTRPDDSMGDDALWEQAEGALRNVLKKMKLDYHLNEGDGAFYGPKIDFHIKDALHRSHQCATIQLDFQMPEKFGLEYIDEKGEKARPVVIHRAVFGSVDRFLGILVEHFAGAFPTWLAPVQARVIPVSYVHNDYAASVKEKLQKAGIRVENDERNEKIGYKIREAQKQKIPYVLVVGDRETESRSVNVRKYGEQQSETFDLAAFISEIQEEIEERRL